MPTERDNRSGYGMGAAQMAAHLGMSLNTFLALVKEGLMPPGKVVRRRRIWSRPTCEGAFEALPDAAVGEQTAPATSLSAGDGDDWLTEV